MLLTNSDVSKYRRVAVNSSLDPAKNIEFLVPTTITRGRSEWEMQQVGAGNHSEKKTGIAVLRKVAQGNYKYQSNSDTFQTELLINI